MTRALPLAIVLAATVAHADVWQHAIDRGAPAVANSTYDEALQAGDDLARQAHGRSMSPRLVRDLVDKAEGQYRNAAIARPDQAEPYFRIGTLIEAFYIECPQIFVSSMLWISPICAPDDGRVNRIVVTAWDEFEKRAPLDPRVGQVMFSRAISRTKLVSDMTTAKPLLEGAMRDYKTILDHADGLTEVALEEVWGNLAETYMMLGRLDEAVDAYAEALKLGTQGASTSYGLAVALDRDERTAAAFEVIRAQGADGFAQFKDKLQHKAVFYVPDGEVYYYLALITEAFGELTDATDYWRKFIKSGAHPQYQPRAKAHLEALVAEQHRHPHPTPRSDPSEWFP